NVTRRGRHAADECHVGVGNQGRAAGGRIAVEVEGDGAGRVVAAADRGFVGNRSADGGAGRGLAGADRGRGRRDAHRFAGGGAADRAVVAVAVVGRHPVVGASGRGNVTRRGRHAADECHVGVGNQGRAAGGRGAVEGEGEGAGRVVAAAARGFVGNRSADDGAGRGLAGSDRGRGRRDAHRFAGGGAADHGVVA